MDEREMRRLQAEAEAAQFVVEANKPAIDEAVKVGRQFEAEREHYTSLARLAMSLQDAQMRRDEQAQEFEAALEKMSNAHVGSDTWRRGEAKTRAIELDLRYAEHDLARLMAESNESMAASTQDLAEETQKLAESTEAMARSTQKMALWTLIIAVFAVVGAAAAWTATIVDLVQR